MRYLKKIGKYMIYIESFIYFICLINIIFIVFFNDYTPSFFRHPVFSLTILVLLVTVPILKKKMK